MAKTIKKELITVMVLAICIAILIPWTVMRWQKNDSPEGDFKIRVKLPDGQIGAMALEKYLVGVVAAEMPAEFEAEALKAQAVAARTFAAKRITQKTLPDQGFDVDTTVSTQVWLSDEQMKDKWSWLGYWRYHAKIEKAIASTKGEVLVENGQYIDSFYHSSSGRKSTERSEEVWSSPRTYLQNVSAEEKNPERFMKTFSFTPQVIYQKLGLSGTPKPFAAGDFEVLARTSAGRAKTVKFLNMVMPATQLRTLMGLPSTDIEWTIKPEELTFKTYGNGHAVGMSQYGANDMAKSKSTYIEILNHFYPGAKILSLSHGPE